MNFEANTTGDDQLQLVNQLQAFADSFWLSDHVTEEQAAEIILDAFKRKVHGQLELLEVKVRR
ncbi:hypothetical protein N9Y42_01680 [Mariniblastus sp.]|nr:hypothetical protein [Mariniblastus sp.]